MALPLSITLEEHFSSRASRVGDEKPSRQFPAPINDRLLDLHHERIKNMDENGVAFQIVSHTPNAHSSAEVIADGNNELFNAVRVNPSRLAGFGQLPMIDAAASAVELERCVNVLGFLGALVDNHAEGNFYDGEEYGRLWDKAVELNVPIYLHPAWPSKKMEEALYSGGALESRPLAATALGAFVFGWHSSTAHTILRLLAGGTFDRHPELKIIIGHSGELLPYMFDRVSKASRLFGLQRSFEEVMHSNIWITTSGMFDVHSLRCLLGNMPLERVMFSVDYPFSDNRLGREYLESIRREKILDGAQLDMFARGNAVKLLFKGRQAQEALSRAKIQ